MLMLLRFVLWSTLHLLFRVRVQGAERLPRDRGALIVSNHVSYVDAVLIGSATPRWIRFLLWKPIYESRFKPVFERLQAIPISSASPKESLAALAKARQALHAGELVGIFPEGQITRTGHLLPFKRGFERIVEQKGSDALTADVIPVWVEGLWGHPLSMKGGKLFASWSRIWRPRITLMIGEPIRHRITPEALHARVSRLATDAARLRDSGTLGARFIHIARRNWTSLAFADATEERTFGQAFIEALLVRRWLERHAPGQPLVGVRLPNSCAAAIANLGVILAGRAVVNLAADRESVGIQTILTSRQFATIAPRPGIVYLEDLLAECSPLHRLTASLTARFLPARQIVRTQQHDLATLIASPHAVELSHANVIANIEGSAQVFNVDRRDTALGVLPFSSNAGFTYSLWFPLLNEFKAVFPTDATSVGALAAKYRATFLLATPSHCATYIDTSQLSHLRYVIALGGQLLPATAEAFQQKFGVPIFAGYGCDEVGAIIAVNGPDFDQIPQQQGHRAGSVGRPLPGVSVRIVDPATLEDRPAGEEGLLLVDSPSRMRGYLGNPARTAQAMHEGSYLTGDLARLSEDGFLSITHSARR